MRNNNYYIFGSLKTYDKSISAIQKTLKHQAAINDKLIIFASVVSVGMLLQSSLNRKLKNEICELHYEINKLKQESGD